MIKLNIFIFTALLLNITEIQCQEILGKWSMVVSEDTYSIPSCLVYEYTIDTLSIYSYDRLFADIPIEYNEDQDLFKENRIKSVEYNLIDYNTLELKRTQNNEVKRDTFVRLIPTKINYPVNMIINKKYKNFYSLSFTNPYEILYFNKVYCSDKYIAYKHSDLSCPRFKLEKLDNTWFIVYYTDSEQKKWMIPIKEINENHLIVYGVYGKTREIKVEEIK